jgi:hypothetical protein
MHKGLGKSFIHILLSKKRSSLTLLVLNSMRLQDLLHCSLLKCDHIGSDNLGIGMLREIPYIPEHKVFFGISITLWSTRLRKRVAVVVNSFFLKGV